MSNAFLQGIDVSHFDGQIDWHAVVRSPDAPVFAYLKASEGGSFKDPLFAANRAGAKAAGLLCGAYHFFDAAVPAEQQAELFIATVGKVAGGLPPVLDVEQTGKLTPQQYAAAVQQWLSVVSSRLGCTPMIYTNASFWNANVGNFGAFTAYPLWIAEYCSAPAPILPAGAGHYNFWQYSASGVVQGISSRVDMDRYNGTRQQLQALLCQ